MSNFVRFAAPRLFFCPVSLAVAVDFPLPTVARASAAALHTLNMELTHATKSHVKTEQIETSIESLAGGLNGPF